MLSFNQELKDEIVAEIIKHREQDQIVQGIYGEGEGDSWKGCAVGCAIHSLNVRKGKNIAYTSHKTYETEFGIPMILAKLEDRIFEGLSVEESKTWPENFMYAVPANTNLSLVWPKFAVWLLNDVIKYAKTDEQRLSIQKVADLYSRVIDGGEVIMEEWKSAHENAASAAADSAAYAAAAAYEPAYAAHDASYAAYAAAAAYAAYAAAYAAAQKIYKIMADKLIEILQNTK